MGGTGIVAAMPPIRSLWLQEALAAPGEADAPRLEGSARADVCIVGGGYTGLWTAIRLKELDPSVDVVIVEADVCGGGASGRNGGFVLSWWTKFLTLSKACGVQEALRLARASAAAVHDIGEFCRANGIDAGFHEDGYLWAATNRSQIGAWEGVIGALAQHGERPFDVLTPDDAAHRAGSPSHMGGVLERTGAIVQPALLARGLRRVAIERGVRVFEHSPMTRLRTRGRFPATLTPGSVARAAVPVVETIHGSIAAERVVLATNAWMVRHAAIRRRIIVVGSDIVATSPIPERLRQIGWTDGLCISDSRLLVHYYRTTGDGRIAFGKGGGLLPFGRWVGKRFEGASRLAARTERHFRQTYPSLNDVPIEVSWTGPIDRSRTGLPFFGQLPGKPGVLVGVGYSGNGVGPSYLGGRILASLALGRDDGWSNAGLVGIPGRRAFPPEPFRFLGGNVVRAAVERKERAEDHDRPVGALTRRLVGLAPAGLVPVKGR
jgi:putative aminophosphonate oxidoreductase